MRCARFIVGWVCFFLLWGANAGPVVDLESPVTLLEPPVALAIHAGKHLYLISENDEEWIVAYAAPNATTTFHRILKSDNNRKILVFSDNTSQIRLRSSVILTPYAYTLPPQKDIPIRSETSTHYVLDFSLGRPPHVHAISVRKSEALRRYDAPEKERIEQAHIARGDRKFNGQWISAEEYARRIAENKAQKEATQSQLSNRAMVATHGFILLRNHQFIEGKFVRVLGSRLYFISQGDTLEKAYTVEQLLSDSAELQLKEGFTRLGEIYMQRFTTAMQSQKWEMVLLELNQFQVYRASSVENKIASPVISSILDTPYGAMTRDWTRFLKENNYEVYENNIFDRKELRQNLDSGKIYFCKAWIFPNQRCEMCHWQGKIKCLTCAEGKVQMICAKCEKGRQVCPICHGRGLRECKACKGKGKFLGVCSRCHGSGEYWEMVYYPARYVTMRNGTTYGHSPISYGNWQSCGSCGGSGYTYHLCQACDGKGEVRCPETIACKACKGKGVVTETCPNCKGSREITCPKCHGQKWTPEIPKRP